MKGLVWDDFHKYDDELNLEERLRLSSATRQMYDELITQFESEGVILEVHDNYARFTSALATGQYAFAMIDLLQNDEQVGIGFAENVRKMMSSEAAFRDLEFPIFIISRHVDQSDVLALDKLGVIPLSKTDVPAAIVFRVRDHLYSLGRWVSAGSAFIIARQASSSLAGRSYHNDDLHLLVEEVKKCGFAPELIDVGSRLDRSMLSRINDRILRAGRVIALLTCDEEIARSGKRRLRITHMARPNVYLELGLVGSRVSVLRRTIIVAHHRVAFPSDFGGREPLKFQKSVTEILPKLQELLGSPQQNAGFVGGV